jgi:uncharacterized repeat protein (TIGR01451 family)
VGDVATYTLTYSNTSAAGADGSTMFDELQTNNGGTNFGTSSVHFVDCTTTGGAVCPTLTDTTINGDGVALNTTIPTFPANSTVIITYQATFNPSSSHTCGSVTNTYVANYFHITAPTGTTNTANDSQGAVYTPTNCAELTVNTSVSPSSLQSGDTFSYAASITNAGPGDANAVKFTDQLSPGLTFGTMACGVVVGSPVCGTLNYDPATGIVSGTIDSLANGETVVFTITGAAGPLPGTYANSSAIAPTASSSVYYDPNPATDSSHVNLQIFNTVSPITITKHVDGLSSSGLLAQKVFTGTITCSAEGSKPWTVTIPAGSSSATANAVQFYDGQSCTVTENAPPTAPSGYAWTSGPVISPASIASLGPTMPVAVSVTNTLVPVAQTTGSIVVTKHVTGLSIAGLPSPMTFTGTITCKPAGGGTDMLPWSVTIAKGSTSADSDVILESAGAICITTEATPPAAPTGFSWTGSPLIAPAATTMGLGTTSTVSVTNALINIGAPTGSIRLTVNVLGGSSSGVSGLFAYTAFCGSAGTFTSSVVFTHATAGTLDFVGIPIGAECTIQQSNRPAAPTGLTWDAPVFSLATVIVVAGDPATVSVANILVAQASTVRALGYTGVDLAAALWTPIVMLILGLSAVLYVSRRRYMRS